MESLFNQLVIFVRRLGWPGTLGLSVGLLLGSVALAAVLVVAWPADKFSCSVPPRFLDGRHPAVRVLGLIGKNLAGYMIVVLGVVMALPGVPGQGALLILIGLTLLDFPGKRRLEGRLIRRPAVARVINSLRKRFKRPPLDLA
jgi:hypothetical protein